MIYYLFFTKNKQTKYLRIVLIYSAGEEKHLLFLLSGLRVVIIIILDLFIYSNFKKREKYLIGLCIYLFFHFF